MKKSLSFLLILISISLAFVSCGKDEKIPVEYNSMILGTWEIQSQDTIVTPSSATDEFEQILSFIEQDSSYAAMSGEDSISSITFSDTTYSVIDGGNVQSAENKYTLDGDLLTLYVGDGDSISMKITYMNNERAILDQDVITMAEIDALFEEMKESLGLYQLIAQSFVDNLKGAGFEKATITRTLIKVE